MKNITLRRSLLFFSFIAIVMIFVAHGLIAIASKPIITALMPGLKLPHLLILFGLSTIASCSTALIAIYLIHKKYLFPIEHLNSTLKSNDILASNQSSITEYTNIIDALHVSKKQISHNNKVIQAHTDKDSLTGLDNRISFKNKFEQTVNLNNEYQNSYALILINVIDFRGINYSHGQETGDLILKTIAKLLLDNLTHTEIIARTGNDEFAVIMNDADKKKISALCLKVAHLVNKRYKISGKSLHLKSRIGATIFNPNTHSSDDYYNQALDASKAAASQQLPYELFALDKSAYNSRRIEISQTIAKFSPENNLGLYLRFQPKINLATGEIAGLEALTRLNHPQLGRIRPDEFIDIAEKDNFISKITDYIIEKSIEQVSAWNKAGKAIPTAVNVSPKDLLDINFPDRVNKLLKKYDLPPHLLELEVTENVVIEDSRITNIVLNRISKLGVSLAIDDFGVGYSGFNNLRSLPFNTLKIDKSFVFGMLHNEEDEIIVTTTIQVAHKLGMKVVAEGIDNLEVAFALTERYCDIGQGFLYSRPVSAEIIEHEYLRHKKIEAQ